MFLKEIPYENYLGVQKTKQARFNLTEAELIDMHFSKQGLDVYIERLAVEKNQAEIQTLLKDLVDKAYGVMSDDGDYFRKEPHMLADFKASPAYNVFMQELYRDPNASVEFIRGCVPKNLRDQYDKALAEKAKAFNEAV